LWLIMSILSNQLPGFVAGLIVGVGFAGMLGFALYARALRKIQQLQANVASAVVSYAKEEVIDRAASAATSWLKGEAKSRIENFAPSSKK